MTRAELRMAILAWLHRQQLRTPVSAEFDATAGFIALAEQTLNELLRARCMVVRSQQQIDGQYMTLPCDYLEMLDIRILGGPPLEYVSRSAAAESLWFATRGSPGNQPTAGSSPVPIVNPSAWPWGDGTPRSFNIIGGEIEFSPFPGPNPNPTPGVQPWPIAEMAYYQRLNLGPADTDTNAVLSTYPSLYLMGALIQSAPFLRDDSRVPTWQNFFASDLAGANAEHDRARSAGSRLVQRFRRVG